MSKVTNNGAGRRVSIRRDEKDFVIAFRPEDPVIFRNRDANTLERVCRFVRWEIVTDTARQHSRPTLRRDPKPLWVIPTQSFTTSTNTASKDPL
jgi:hypothetical protein